MSCKTRNFYRIIMKKIGLLWCLLWPLFVSAQIDDFSDFADQSDFAAFQQQSEQRFANFQDSINQRFAKELARQWEEYELFQAKTRPQKPKPTAPVIAPKDSTPKIPTELPVGNVIQPSDTTNPSIPTQDALPSNPTPAPIDVPEETSFETDSTPEPTPIDIPEETTPETDSTPEPTPIDIPEETPLEEWLPSTEQSYKVSIDFYQQPLTLSMPAAYTDVSIQDISEKSVANLWTQFSQYDVSDYVSQCRYFKQQYHYNDWAVYEMVCDFARSAFPKQYAVQTVFTVFLLNQLDIDAQMGRKSNRLVVLLPSQTTIYAVPYIKHEDKFYYMFSLYPGVDNLQSSIYTYSVKYTDKARAVDLHIAQPIRFPFQPSGITYTTPYWSDEEENPIPLKTNQNILDFYTHYPQVDMTVYATAQMTQELMDWAEQQIVPLLSEVTPELAVMLLMDYIQHDFDYATDDQQFGYEKPFFCEENFYYAKNDCEDRAILLSYFVRNFVQADIVLLDYPDHIATAIAFPEDNEITGDYYLLNGRKYFVCDPTYIGAGIGETMPQYKNVKPNVIKLK